MKTVKLDRTHQEDLSEISTFNSNITHNLFTANTPSRPHNSPQSHISCTNQSVDPRTNQPRSQLTNYTNIGSMNTKMKTDTK